VTTAAWLALVEVSHFGHSCCLMTGHRVEGTDLTLTSPTHDDNKTKVRLRLKTEQEDKVGRKRTIVLGHV
jgi:hypothetical protein